MHPAMFSTSFRHSGPVPLHPYPRCVGMIGVAGSHLLLFQIRKIHSNLLTTASFNTPNRVCPGYSQDKPVFVVRSLLGRESEAGPDMR